MSTLLTFAPALPEIVLAAGAMVLLMLGVFRADTERNGTSVGWLAVLLMLLFLGSSDFSEKISAGKYPGYAEYQKRVPRFWPGLF